ncbi:MAG: hypothetical protein J0L80_16145 [Chitinophagales bacterium]|nr:hypothetical protein [Chitinophagales bacterium]
MKSFTEIVSAFEDWLKRRYITYELLELYSTPYSFGSGFIAYKANGRNTKIVFDGRDNIVSIYVSPPHHKYPTNEWDLRFEGNIEKYEQLDFSTIYNN